MEINVNCCISCGQVFETTDGYEGYCESCRATQPKGMEKTCVSCGRKYQTIQVFSIYCPECKEIRSKRCKICGCEIENGGGNKKYCPECAKQMSKSNSRDNFKLHKDRSAAARSAEKRKAKRMESSGLTLQDAVKLSQLSRHKLSYGKIIEKYGDMKYDVALMLMQSRGEVIS